MRDFENRQNRKKVSIILLDWNVRESAHSLDYFNNQTVPREEYEILWIEYYDKIFGEIKEKNLKYIESGSIPAVDKWFILEMPKEYYYHKHLMYNLGILYSSGDIIVICDSDGVVKPTFIQTIIEEFSKDPNIILHMDQLRNFDRKYHPFNYPSIDEIERTAANYQNGKTTGLWDTTDIIHTRNYGACFCAKRADLISIGGADEHIDYLGHVCGPYELTFRLVNAGKTEKWHQKEMMYHVWHPGQAGDGNFTGPHDGKMMSTTALAIRENKRIFPLVENEFIHQLRISNQYECLIPFTELMKEIRKTPQIETWKIDLKKMTPSKYACHDHNISVYSLSHTYETQKDSPLSFQKRFLRKWKLLIQKGYVSLNKSLGRGYDNTISNDIMLLLGRTGMSQNSIVCCFATRIQKIVDKFID